MMIPQEHPEALWPEDEAPFHVEETPSWRARSRLVRILGVAVPLVAGFGLAFPSYLPLGVYSLLPIFVGLLSAGLFRSWWALLTVPVAFSVGFVLSNIIQMGGLDVQSWAASNFEGVDILVILGVVPVNIGVFIGTPLGKMIEKRLQKRATPL